MIFSIPLMFLSVIGLQNTSGYNFTSSINARASFNYCFEYNGVSYFPSVDLDFNFTCYFNDDEDYVIYLTKVSSKCVTFNDEGEIIYSDDNGGSFSYDFEVLNTQTFTFACYQDDVDFDLRFYVDGFSGYNLFTFEDVIYAGQDLLSFDTSIDMSTLPISDIIRSSMSNQNWLNGYNQGVADTESNYPLIRQEGYNQGYVAGYNEGGSQDSVALAIFSGIINVGLTPVNFFLGILNFEVFGINIGGFVSGLLTISVIVILLRTIFSGGNGGKEG